MIVASPIPIIDTIEFAHSPCKQNFSKQGGSCLMPVQPMYLHPDSDVNGAPALGSIFLTIGAN